MLSLFHLFTFILSTKVKKNCQTVADVFQLAKYHYHQQEFVECYRLCYQLENTFHHETTLHQVQCLLQLGHWRKAITTLTNKIKKEPQEPKWYLRISEIYMQRMEYRLAWEILYRAPIVDNEIKHQQRLCIEAKGGVKRRDILDAFPFEVLVEIFTCLDLSSLVNCSRVNLQWRQFIVSTPALWNQLEFSSINNVDTIRVYISRSTRLRRLTIKNQQVSGDQVLMLLVKHESCHRLKSLELTDIICTPALLFNTLNYIAGTSLTRLHWSGITVRLNELIENLPKRIQLLTVHDCFTCLQATQYNQNNLRLEHFGDSPPLSAATDYYVELTILELSGIHGLTSLQLLNILRRFPNLKRLTLKKCLVNIIPVLNMVRSCCPKLQYFDYERNKYYQRFDTSFQHSRYLDKNHYYFTNQWISIKIRMSNMLSDDIIHDVLYSSAHSLKELCLAGNNKSMTSLPKHINSLKVLNLNECYGLTSQALKEIILANTLQLESINVSYLSIVNNDIITALSNCSLLTTVDISGCDLSLVSADLIKEWITKRKDQLKNVSLCNATHISMDLIAFVIKSIQQGFI